ncbi:ComF family protein [Euryhalocaulis caribicus]|uniref:ComF family protein n=1 Tax=Euryhalocaulis caribicus TaxID=1161401 RepID=UPI0003A8EF78|nr:ComF family protein [Euryhalocaulis caribicus]
MPVRYADKAWGKRAALLPGAAARAALDALLPPLSPLSTEPVSRAGDVSATLWGALDFIEAPFCDTCGTPFSFEVEGAAVCGACAARPPRYGKARSALAYDDASRKLVLAFKHGGRRDALPAFADWMARAAGPLLAEADYIAPVPLHYSRLIRRRFNQSGVLARALAARSGAVFDPDSLYRRRRTQTQAGKTRRGRRRNVAGAFAVRQSAADRMRGARVLLIDDVLTTGATLEACARALRQAGAVEVNAVTLARVAKPLDPLA